MKKLLIISTAFLVIFTVACGRANQGNEENSKNTTNSEVKTETHSTIKLSKDQFLKKVMNFEKNKEWKYEGDLPAIVDFYADWCAPCKMAAPVLEDLAKEYKGKIHIYKVDVQKEKELAAAFGISSIPSLLFIPMEGKPQMSSGIGRTPEDTKKMFKELIEKVLLEKK